MEERYRKARHIEILKGINITIDGGKRMKKQYREIRGKRFMLDLTPAQHENVKEMSVKIGMSMHRYIVLAIAELGSKLNKKGGKNE